MKYKHYSPNTKCKLIYCKDDLDQIFYLKKYVKEYKGNVVIVGFKEHEDQLLVSEGRFISVGSQYNYEEIARNIFSALRQADEIKPEIILIEGLKKEGMGLAIMNRLLRTCEYDYIEK